MLRDDPERADEVFAHRALTRLAQGRRAEAESDAQDAYRRRPSASRERLWVRTLLALGRVEELLWLDNPEDLDVLPGGGASLRADLRAAAGLLVSPTERLSVAPALAARTRSVLLAALGEPAAEAEASRAVALVPQSPEALLVRARIRRRAGDRAGAAADVDAGLAFDPGNPRLLELRGVLALDSRNPAAALVFLNRAVIRGARGTARIPRALALMALDRASEALEIWSVALDDDPEDPRLYLGRARALLRLGQVDRALVDLEQAVDWSGDNAGLLVRITTSYAACLARRPDQLVHWLELVRRAGERWVTTVRGGRDQ